MVHAADTCFDIADAGRHTRPEHGDNHHVLVGKVEFTRQHLCGMDVESLVKVEIGGDMRLNYFIHSANASLSLKRLLQHGLT